MWRSFEDFNTALFPRTLPQDNGKIWTREPTAAEARQELAWCSSQLDGAYTSEWTPPAGHVTAVPLYLAGAVPAPLPKSPEAEEGHESRVRQVVWSRATTSTLPVFPLDLMGPD